MTIERRWWDGPWPWLIYLATYGIPWLWTPPDARQLLLSALGLGVFLAAYVISFRQSGRGLLLAVATMVVIGIALLPVGGGWTSLALYPTIQAARVRPRRVAVWAMSASVAAFFCAGLVSGQPWVWWLPGLMLPALTGGALLSHQAFIDQAKALLATQEEVRRLAGLAERERMARDLHDVVGRTLTLVALKGDLMARLAPRDSEAAVAEARAIAEQARCGLAEIRAALSGYAGGSLVSEMATSVRALESSGIAAEVRGDPAAAPHDAGALLAMTLREAITNVIRHSAASHCRIGLIVTPSRARLVVEDDGTGGSFIEGAGLTGMRQRLVAAGGRLVLETGASGTRLVADIPT